LPSWKNPAPETRDFGKHAGVDVALRAAGFVTAGSDDGINARHCRLPHRADGHGCGRRPAPAAACRPFGRTMSPAWKPPSWLDPGRPDFSAGPVIQADRERTAVVDNRRAAFEEQARPPLAARPQRLLAAVHNTYRQVSYSEHALTGLVTLPLRALRKPLQTGV
jgi:hypothetical protein